MAVHNIFREFPQERVYSRWKKTNPGMLSCLRLNPHDHNLPPLEVVLSPSQKPDGTFVDDYDTAVIELYSKTEDEAFRRLNRRLIEKGYLAPYAGVETPIDATNAVSDDELRGLLTLKTPASLRKALAKYTSALPIQRLRSLVTDTTPKWIIDEVDAALKQWREKSMPLSASEEQTP